MKKRIGRASYAVRQHDVFTPHEITEQYDHDVLPADVQRILEVIDTTDPAWPAIAGALRELIAAGIDIDASVAVAAVKLGRQRCPASVPGPKLPVQLGLASATDSIVYYIRRGDLIKIGTTKRPRHRFSCLMPDEILAFEPGARPKESQRHTEFKHLRYNRRREYFLPGPELLTHARRIRSVYGDPDPSWPTATTPSEALRHAAVKSTETMTAREAETSLGINRATLRSWVIRGRLQATGIGEERRHLYYREHLITLRDSPREGRVVRA